MTCSSIPVDMRGTQLVPATGWRNCENASFCPPIHCRAGSRSRTTKQSVLKIVELAVVDLQLRFANDRVDAHIHEGRDDNRTRNGDAVFQIAGQAQVAARSDQLLEAEQGYSSSWRPERSGRWSPCRPGCEDLWGRM